jgi:membrane-bound ClpP family serine protease
MHPPQTPDHALLLLTLGVLLVYVELNRPGLIVAGMVGLLAILLAVVPFLHPHPPAASWVPIAAAVATFARALRYDTSTTLLAGATICLTYGFLRLPTDLAAALPCGLLLGLSTSWLVRIARRARVNKGHP